jgi:hypothetical protein
MKFIILLLFICSFNVTYSQDLTGTWTGYLKLYIPNERRIGRDRDWQKDSLYMHLEILQQNRKLTSIIYYAKPSSKEIPLAVFKASGLLDKKNPLSFFRIIKDGLLQDNTKNQLAIGFFNSIDVVYATHDSTEILYGNWHNNNNSNWIYSVKKITPLVSSALENLVADKK